MYISKLRIQNYRCFEDTTVEFEPGVSVIIGENNSGKSSLLSALRLIFEGGGARSLERYDFYQGIEDFSKPPRISITATLSSSGEDDTEEELGTVATWLSKVDENDWEAKLTYHFYLPESEKEKFDNLIDDDEKPTKKSFWSALKFVLPRYVARIDAGEPGVDQPGHQRVEARDLSAFGVSFLDAIRDVEREMFSGRKPKLRAMLQMALDKDDKATKELEKKAGKLVESLRSRIDLDSLFELVEDTGAQDGGEPDLDDNMLEEDIIRALRLVVESDNGTLPVTYNGLGYNNLLYISLILASLNRKTAEKVGSENAVVFPMLLIEEPEAHLHPALQFKLLKFINDREDEEGTGRVDSSDQVFVTSHSTHVTSATDLDALIALSKDSSGAITASYPGRVYAHIDENTELDGIESKAYVERFLDATKSAMLFARRVILVEGIAEQILIPTFANHMGVSLAEEHVAVVAVGGSTFKHFLPIFGGGTNTNYYNTLDRRIACIVDADPSRRKGNSGQYSACYPYEIEQEQNGYYEYKQESGVVSNLKSYTESPENISVFCGDKTLEYDLAKANSTCDALITSHCTHEKHLRAFVEGDTLHKLLENKIREEDRLEILMQIEDDDRQRSALFATCYLECVKGKGEHAQALNLQLLEAGKAAYEVPEYISNAIEWVCQ